MTPLDPRLTVRLDDRRAKRRTEAELTRRHRRVVRALLLLCGAAAAVGAVLTIAGSPGPWLLLAFGGALGTHVARTTYQSMTDRLVRLARQERIAANAAARAPHR